MKYFLLFTILFLSLVNSGHLLNCLSCQGGYDVPGQLCSDVRPDGMSIACSGVNAHCYQAIVWYQNGALRLVQRDCWVPPANNRSATWCQSFSSPVGRVQECKICRGELCNNERIVRVQECRKEEENWF